MEHLTVSLFLTRRCSSRCRHCGAWYTKSAADDFTTRDIGRFVAEIARTPGIEAVGLSGGEVFVVKELFDFAVDELVKARLPFTFVTNAFWAKSERIARDTLGRYRETLGMGLSADSFHQEFVPLARVVNAARAAQSLGIPYVVRATMKASEREGETIKRLLDAGLPNPEAIACAPVMFIGRARKKIDPEEFPDENPARPCLSLRTPFIFPNGDVYACCGEAANIEGRHPLFLGSLNETRLIDLVARYETDPVLKAIYEEGPRTLYERSGASPKDLPSRQPSLSLTIRISLFQRFLRSIRMIGPMAGRY